MKIIFLDMDGVMVTPRACIMYGDKGVGSYIDPVAIHAINSLCERSDAKIVISSSWRKFLSVSALRSILGAAGVNQKHFFFNKNYKDAGFFTPQGYDCRGTQIQHWINSHYKEITHYLILDDDSDMLSEQQDNFIQTDPYNGITYENFLQAEKILGVK